MINIKNKKISLIKFSMHSGNKFKEELFSLNTLWIKVIVLLGDPRDRHFHPFMLNNPLRKIIANPRKLIEKFVKEGDYVADIGAGPGIYTIELAKIVGEKGKVFASDSDINMVNIIKKKINKLNLKNVVVELASADNIKFIESNKIDFAFSNGVLCCMVNHKGAIQEINRVLKENGVAFISVEKLSKGLTAISKNEWKDLINKFNVIEEKEGLFYRYAVISKSILIKASY